MFFGFHFLNILFFFVFVNQIVVLLAPVPAFLLFCRSAGPCVCLPAVLPFCWPLCLPSCCFAVLLAPVSAFLLFCRSAGLCACLSAVLLFCWLLCLPSCRSVGLLAFVLCSMRFGLLGDSR
ncbi:hypothetical protein [Thiolapillus sp.]|uniref:hypothetical protein n=1 Tax=Thiolapillus sp. TaxID=2017437 RepID=UPI003AF82B95